MPPCCQSSSSPATRSRPSRRSRASARLRRRRALPPRDLVGRRRQANPAGTSRPGTHRHEENLFVPFLFAGSCWWNCFEILLDALQQLRAQRHVRALEPGEDSVLKVPLAARHQVGEIVRIADVLRGEPGMNRARHREDLALLLRDHFEYRSAEGLGLEESMVNHTSKSVSHGVGVRVCAEDRTGYAYSDEVTTDRMRLAAEAARAIADQRGTTPAAVQVGAPVARHALYDLDSTPLDVPVQERARLLNEIDRVVRASDARVKNVLASFTCERKIVMVVN